MFKFKQFTVHQDRCAMKVTTDGCLFGAWAAKMARDSFPLRILDIGSGTGLLSLMTAQQLTSAEIDAIEMNEAAFQQSKENFMASPWSERLHAIRADARHYELGKTYDIIISNPPFYEKEWSSEDPGRKMAHHGSGLLLNELAQIIHQNLSATGKFYLLLPFKRKEELFKLLSNAGLRISSLLFVKQTPAHDYFRIMIEGRPGTTKEKDEILFDEMTIKNEKDLYSPAFIDLLKEYYLYL